MRQKGKSSEFLRGIVALDGFGLNRDGSVATLVELRTVGDCSNDVAGRESEGGSECGECCNEH